VSRAIITPFYIISSGFRYDSKSLSYQPSCRRNVDLCLEMYPFHGISNTVLFTCRNSTTQWNIIHESVYGYGLHRLEVSSCRECKHQPDSRFILSLHTFKRQEAHLSQRDRATLRVTECFAKSLKVIRNDTLQFSV